MVAFGVVMLAIQAYVFFGAPPASEAAAAWTALASYLSFTVIIGVLEGPRERAVVPAAKV